MANTNKTIAGCGFHHVSMKARDLDASIKFYTESLGFVEKYSWGEGQRRVVLLDTGDGNYFEISQGAPDQVHADGAFGHIALRVDDCGAALEAARAAGVEVTVETKEVNLASDPPLKVRVAFFKGPDGEVVEFFEDDLT